jgi:signal transduction histidine kinase
MSKVELEGIGRPFFTTKTSGTGLGLSVTIRIIESLEGEMRFNSIQGEGTEVIIKIPSAT